MGEPGSEKEKVSNTTQTHHGHSTRSIEEKLGQQRKEIEIHFFPLGLCLSCTVVTEVSPLPFGGHGQQDNMSSFVALCLRVGGSPFASSFPPFK